jgi:hypothetical protein
MNSRGTFTFSGQRPRFRRLSTLASQRLTRRTGQFVFDAGGSNIVGVPEYRGSRLLRIVELLLEVDGDADMETIRELARHYQDEFVARGLVRMVCSKFDIEPGDAASRLGLEEFAGSLRTVSAWAPSSIVIDV